MKYVFGTIKSVAEQVLKGGDGHTADNETQVLSLLCRRPCTIGDIQDALSLGFAEAVKHTRHLVAKQLVSRRRVGGKVFFVAAPVATVVSELIRKPKIHKKR